MPDFDSVDKIEKAINENLKKSSEINQDFGRFKGEFFAINEVIINKDISHLKLSSVKAQRNKQEKILDQMAYVEINVGGNNTNLESIKDRFNNFQKEIFEKKFDTV
jgi:hypothetical protein